MSLSSADMQKLMAYADGELGDSEVAEIESLLAKEVDAVRFIEQIAGLGTLVKEGHEARHAKDVARFDVADLVMAQVKVKDEKPSSGSRPSVSSLEAARKKRAQRYTVGAGVIAALALAASVFLFNRPEETPMARAPVGPATNPVNGGSETAMPGVEVEAAESPGQSVKVFYGPGSNELTTSVVIWVDDTGEKK